MNGEILSIETLEKLKENEEELKSANESITWWSNRFKAVERDNKKLNEALEKISIYVTNLLDENMIGSKYGKEILEMCINHE